MVIISCMNKYNRFVFAYICTHYIEILHVRHIKPVHNPKSRRHSSLQLLLSLLGKYIGICGPLLHLLPHPLLCYQGNGTHKYHSERQSTPFLNSIHNSIHQALLLPPTDRNFCMPCNYSFLALCIPSSSHRMLHNIHIELVDTC